MTLDERSYSGKMFRPKPEIYLEEDSSFGVIATPWGPRASAKRATEILKDYVLSARQDMEATSPFQKLTCLSPLANNLRVGVMLANDSLYREENRQEYIAGVELLVFAHQEGELAFAQVGNPSLFLAREGLPWIPLSTQIDLSTELSHARTLLAPLPQNVIGMHTTTNLNISSVKTLPGDRLVFLSHSHLSHPLYALPFDDATLEGVSQALSERHPELPFWLGVLPVR